MKHIFFINSLDKLNINKDSSLMLALTFQQEGEEVYLLFENDFYVCNHQNMEFALFKFNGKFKKDGCYIDSLTLGHSEVLPIEEEDYFHMRIDPPVDARYIRYLWMQKILVSKGVVVLNSPTGILANNEKIFAYEHPQYSIDTFVGSSLADFKRYVEQLINDGVEEIIIKPMDLYCGIGIEKLAIAGPGIVKVFMEKVKEFSGALIVQPFIKDVYQGEQRSIYFDGAELGTIIKIPSEGEFLSNIAQGARFKKSTLSPVMESACNELAAELLSQGVRLIAFDILGEKITEVNITCPGLIVETSFANQKNLGREILMKIRANL